MMRRQMPKFLSLIDQAPAVWRVSAGDDVDQRRLAGTVFAKQHVDLAMRQIEVDAVQRLHAGKTL
jgi:hypothetical protein